MVIAMILFIAYRGNLPMSVPQAPQGITYFEFMADRIDAAKTVKPSQCGWGMMLSLAALGPIYSVVYTTVAVNPDSALAKGTAPDPDIARDVAGAAWYQIPDIWWKTVSDYPGRCWVNLLRMVVSSDLSKSLNIRINMTTLDHA